MIEAVNLAEWARANGVSGQRASRWFHAGVLAAPARQLATGTILVEEASHTPAGVALYARVSSGDQRGDLDCQVSRLTEAEVADDVVRDMVEVLTSFCARLYGRRSARRRAQAAVAAAGTEAAT